MEFVTVINENERLSLLNAYYLLNVTALVDYEQSLFFLVPSKKKLIRRFRVKRARHANNHAWTEVTRRERRPRFSHLAASARVHSPV